MIKELFVIEEALKPLNFYVVKSESGTMDSGIVQFTNGTKQIHITKDKSQWIIPGERKDLEPKGLWKAFDDTHEFKDVLVSYIKT
jgi:hypothetical protein